VLDKQMRLGLQEVMRSDDGIGDMVKHVELFCKAIDNEQLPDDTQLTAPQVSALFAQPEGAVELEANALQLIEEWSAVKDALKNYEEQERTLKDKLANMLRGAEYGTINSQKVLSYKAQSTKRLDTKALAEAHPEIATAYTTASTFRVLRITK
jgi:predicted phage-related endonuclease